MKKRYIKPELISVETIVPDQAIAGCQKTDHNGVSVELKGYGVAWDQNNWRNVDGLNSLPQTYEEAANLHQGEVAAIYMVKKNNEYYVYADFAPYNGIEHEVDSGVKHNGCSCGNPQDQVGTFQFDWNNGTLRGQWGS